MSSKDKYGKFKKKDYVRIIESVRNYLCRKFGYKIKPHIFETQLKENALMMFTHTASGYAILYDYRQFKEMFGHRDFQTQEAYAGAIMAHEMRHYYQHRQMIAQKPKEKVETVALWWENEWNPKFFGEGCSLSEFLLQPLELDATLFEYVFGAEIFEVLLLQAIKDEEHLNAMEKLYIEYFGETDTDLFNDEIRVILKKRSNKTDKFTPERF